MLHALQAPYGAQSMPTGKRAAAGPVYRGIVFRVVRHDPVLPFREQDAPAPNSKPGAGCSRHYLRIQLGIVLRSCCASFILINIVVYKGV